MTSTPDPATFLTRELETARTVVYPWQCDRMGHFATQHYMKVFDDATFHLLGWLGYELRDALRERRGWADVSHNITYRRELTDGDLVVAMSCVVRLGKTSLTYRHRLARVSERNVDCAVLDGVAVYFDLDRRVAIALPDAVRTACRNSDMHA